MSDTISRQAAIDAILTYRHSVLSAEEIIDTVPSAQPNIIHCRYCDKCQYDTLFDKYWCNGREVREDFFCGDAVRKENR